MYVAYSLCKPEPEISEIYFLSCWFYKTISRHHVSLCQSPCWTMLVLFTWKRKLAWAAAFINFPFLFSPTTCLSWHGEGPFWAQQVVLCAWHHLKLVQVSGGRFAVFPLRMFADPKKQPCLTCFSCLWQASFPVFFLLEGIHWRKVVTSLTNYYSTYKMHLNQERQEVTHGIFYIYEPKKMQIEKSSQNQTVKVHNITDVTALSCT